MEWLRIALYAVSFIGAAYIVFYVVFFVWILITMNVINRLFKEDSWNGIEF